jgi:hypothetical protein
VCLDDIRYGSHYYDGGGSRRSHVECATDPGMRELTREEIDSIEAAEVVVSKAKGEVYRAERALEKLRLQLLAKGGAS